MALRSTSVTTPSARGRTGRRAALRLACAAGAWLLTGAHTPYRQWTLFRRTHLLIGSTRADAPSYAIGQQVATLLAEALPESRARVSRAPDLWRLASLISTGQWQVAIVARDDARAMTIGAAPFEDFGPIALRGLLEIGEHRLICRADFPDRHAYLVTATLAEHMERLPHATPPDPSDPEIAIHPGALAYLIGLPPPQAATVAEDQ